MMVLHQAKSTHMKLKSLSKNFISWVDQATCIYLCPELSDGLLVLVKYKYNQQKQIY